jgi:alkyl hydroperoxide reductase subunit AhpC
MTVQIGKQAPDFSAEAYHLGEMKTIRLADYRGQWVVLFFYPADFTYVWPTEMAAVAVKYPAFQEIGVEILTISVDSAATHRDWHERELSRMVPGGARYPMLSDPGGKIGSQYGVYDPDQKVDLRGRFIIDPEGMIQAIEILGIPVGRDVSELLRELRAFRQHRQTGELIPCGWQPGKPTLPEEESAKKIAGRIWEVWKPKNAF